MVAYSAITLNNAKYVQEGLPSMSLDVYLPAGATPPLPPPPPPSNGGGGGGGNAEPVSYYSGTRFDWSSMIGNVRFNGNSLYGTDMWRMPHNTHWPESGVGLASEFGVGDDGDFCFYRCGWPLTGGITNGVLGYRQAKQGEPFLKVGVGLLIKGSCPACDSAEDYKFNSPYIFAEQPVWTWTTTNNNNNNLIAVSLRNQATLREYGYQLTKDIELTNDNVLLVTTTLTNTGAQPFSTVWYSHHFFTCDSIAIGPGYSVKLGVSYYGKSPLYEEPGTWSWSTPLAQYANIRPSSDGSVRIDMTRAMEWGVRIKTEFVKDDNTSGAFLVQACGTSILSTLQTADEFPLEMYAYNLYLERGTLSPEPQILLNLLPGSSRRWTQRLHFRTLNETPPLRTSNNNLPPPNLNYFAPPQPLEHFSSKSSLGGIVTGFFFVVVAVGFFFSKNGTFDPRRHSYTRIRDNAEEQQEQPTPALGTPATTTPS